MSGVTGSTIACLGKFVFNKQKPVVFCGAFAAAGSTGFNLSRVNGNCEVGNKGVLGLARAVRYNSIVSVLLCNINNFKRFAERTYLVWFL